MSKILVNNTANPVSITDVGITVPGSGNYTIQQQDYLLFAASSNVVTLVGDETLTVNDGSEDLSISDGIDLIKGISSKKIIGGSTGAVIGNIGDELKVTASITNAPAQSIEWPHYMVHVGRSFSYHSIFTLGLNVNSDIQIVTPTSGTRACHFTFSLNIGADSTVAIYETPTLVQGSQITTIYNRNRNSATTPVTSLYNVTSVSNTGTAIWAERMGMAGGGGNNAEGASNELQEFILKTNTTYLFRVTSNSNQNIHSLSIHWYEYDYANPP